MNEETPTTQPVAATPPPQPEPQLIPIEDFMRIDLRVARILQAEPIPKSKKLLRLEVDVGEFGKRQICAGIANQYIPEELIGRLIVVVANLKPAMLMGHESRGMLLAATTAEGAPILLTPSADVQPGAKVR